jgi:hypothetical protein
MKRNAEIGLFTKPSRLVMSTNLPRTPSPRKALMQRSQSLGRVCPSCLPPQTIEIEIGIEIEKIKRHPITKPSNPWLRGRRGQVRPARVSRKASLSMNARTSISIAISISISISMKRYREILAVRFIRALFFGPLVRICSL